MKFEEMELKRPNTKKYERKINELIEIVKKDESLESVKKATKKIFKLEDEYNSLITIVQVNYTIDTLNKKFEKLNTLWDEESPKIYSYFTNFYNALVESKFRKDLEKVFSPYFFTILENRKKVNDEKLIPLLIEENKLVTEYEKIFAQGVVLFKGEELPLTKVSKYMSSIDKKEREEASNAYWKYIEENDEKLGDIYDKLVHLRDKIAKTVGFSRYTEYQYISLGRVDYTPSMVESYRKQIETAVVPEVNKLMKRQAKRLHIKKPDFLDYNLEFLSGNPKPCGDSKTLTKIAQDMYNDMSKESGEFFNFMVTNNLMDLDAKHGKMGGGYMTYIPKYKSPFIFSNSNGTSQDVDTLTHEVGHAFQGYLGSKISVPILRSPTLEGAEVDSMSMEFFAYPYMEHFFKEDKDKYLFSHLEGTLDFLPYGAEVDEFQAWVFDNIDATHEERCNKWKELDKKYRPHLDFSKNEFLNKGKQRMRQSHIFSTPFYYIDYTLAQVLALEFKNLMDKDYKKAWNKYVKLLKLGGKYPFVELISKVHLKNPFIDGTIKKVIRPQVKNLKMVDDMKL